MTVFVRVSMKFNVKDETFFDTTETFRVCFLWYFTCIGELRPEFS